MPIAPPHIFQHPSELWTAGVLTAHTVDVDLVHAQRLHEDFLPDGVLLLGAHSDITDFHVLTLLSGSTYFLFVLCYIRKE